MPDNNTADPYADIAASDPYGDVPAAPSPSAMQTAGNAIKTGADIAESAVSNPIGRLLGHGLAMTAYNLHRAMPGATREEGDALYQHIINGTDSMFTPSTPQGQAVQAFLGHLTAPISAVIEYAATKSTDDPIRQDAIRTGIQATLMGVGPKTTQAIGRGAAAAGEGALRATATGGPVAGAAIGGHIGGFEGAYVGKQIGGLAAKGAQAALDKLAARKVAKTLGEDAEPMPELKDQPSFAGERLNSGNGPADVPTPPTPFVGDAQQPGGGPYEFPTTPRIKDTPEAVSKGQRDAKGRFRPISPAVDQFLNNNRGQ